MPDHTAGDRARVPAQVCLIPSLKAAIPTPQSQEQRGTQPSRKPDCLCTGRQLSLAPWAKLTTLMTPQLQAGICSVQDMLTHTQHV